VASLIPFLLPSDLPHLASRRQHLSPTQSRELGAVPSSVRTRPRVSRLSKYISIATYLSARVLRTHISHPSSCGATEPLSTPVNSHARHNLGATRAASRRHSGDARVMRRAATIRTEPIRRSKSDRSRTETRLECTSSWTSRRALRFVDLHRLRRCLLPSSPLASASLCAVRSVNCGCVRPALCISSFRDRSNRSGGDPCGRPHRAHSSRRYLTCAPCAHSSQCNGSLAKTDTRRTVMNL